MMPVKSAKVPPEAKIVKPRLPQPFGEISPKVCSQFGSVDAGKKPPPSCPKIKPIEVEAEETCLGVLKILVKSIPQPQAA